VFECGLCRERPVRERWVAGAENQVRLDLGAEFLALGADALDSVGERRGGGGCQRVAGRGGYSHSSSR
jgi:hypothetical protein